MLVFIFLICCKDKKIITHNKIKPNIEENLQPKDTLVEVFVDSLNIGIKGKFKIDLKKFRNNDSVYVKINFFEKINSKWIVKQQFAFPKDGISGCEVELKDFNNDGFNDMTFQSNIAARGSNIVRKLFIFEKQKGEMTYIKNSENFPNIRYNKKLNCVDAFMVFGGSQTVFMKIRSDTLWAFAKVNLTDRIIITEIDAQGKETELRNDNYDTEDSYVRFSNYKPLTESEQDY